MGQFSTKLKDALWNFKENKKAKVVVCGILIIIIIAAAGWYFFVKKDNTTSYSQTNQNVSSFLDRFTTNRRVIDGVETAEGNENIYPTAVMIENLITVRPQSGLQNAGIIYEALAEGGITRFMAIYADNSAPINEIGPVRSARPYFVDWAEEYKAVYAHAGGSPQALSQLAESKDIININQIGGDQVYFWRSTDVSAPHNLFTSSALIDLAHRDKDVAKKGDYEGWKFKDEETPLASRPKEPIELAIEFSSYSYNVRYTYDSDTNTYLRFQGDEAHTDKNTDKQLAAKNILVQMVQTELLDTASGRLGITTTGSGTAHIFTAGKKITGTWKKDEGSSRTLFYDEKGKEVELEPGQIWIEAVPTDRTVTYNSETL